MDLRPIAVIDDDDCSRESMVSLLRSIGFEAHAYHSAASYLADAVMDWGCVISDIQMPEMDGFQLLSALRRRPEGPPVVLTTAFSIANVQRRAVEAGAVWFFEKPVEEAALLTQLAAILARRP